VRKTKLALVQFASDPMNIEGNADKAIAFIEEAGGQGADLVVFPELFLTGYDTDLIGEKYAELAQSAEGAIVRSLQEAARRARVNVVAPMPLKLEGGAGVGNGAVIIARDGSVAGTFNKVHLWEDERKHFVPGDGFAAIALDFGKLGVQICYDAGFPESSRTLALQGAELLVVPSAFSLPDKHRWDLYFPARALENTCFVAAVNGVGGQGAFELYGNNKVAGPRGELLLDGVMHEETMQIVEIDLEENLNAAKSIPYLRDIRIDAYAYRA
jgi:Predicted amidohydrolase